MKKEGRIYSGHSYGETGPIAEDYLVQPETRETPGNGRGEILARLEKLSAEIGEAVRDLTTSTAHRVLQSVVLEQAAPRVFRIVRRHPVTTALATLGAGYLIARKLNALPSGERMREIGERARDRTSDLANRLGSTIADKSHRMRERAHTTRERTADLAWRARHTASEKLAHAGEIARDKGHEARERASTTYRENPVVAGLLFFGLGAGLAILLPRSRREDKIIGPARDALLDKTKDAGHIAAEKMRASTREAIRDVEKDLHKGLSETTEDLSKRITPH